MPLKPKILFCLSRFPYPLEKGDKLRAYQQMRYLSQFYTIDLFVVFENILLEYNLVL